MASTFSPTLRLELIGDGDQSGIWGQTTNTNLGALLEQAITGVQTINMTDANYTLTSFNGVVDEARNAVLIFTGTLSQQRNIVAPLVEKIYTIRNNTTGGYGIQIIGASGTGVVIPNGVTASVYCDGTNFNPLQVNSIGNQTINGNLAVTGTTSLTGNLTASTATFSGTVALGGTPTAPTAAPGTNTTQIATTAYVQNITSSLGTMAQQNANNVAITGGAINGTTIGASNPTTVRGTTGTFTGALSAASGAFSGAVSGTTGTFSGAMSADSLAGNAATGSGASGTWSINIGGNAATATNSTNATTVTGATQNNITSIPNLATVGTITSGTWSGSFGAVSGANLTNLNASNLGSGTVPAARLTGTYNISISGNAATATSATTATTATTATNATQFQGKSQLGLGLTGEVWNDVTGSRSAGTTYTNSRAYPIAVIMQVGAQTNGIYIYLNGTLVIRHWYDVNGGAGQVGYSSGMIIVPPGGTYTCTNGPLRLWWELY